MFGMFQGCFVGVSFCYPPNWREVGSQTTNPNLCKPYRSNKKNINYGYWKGCPFFFGGGGDDFVLILLVTIASCQLFPQHPRHETNLATTFLGTSTFEASVNPSRIKPFYVPGSINSWYLDWTRPTFNKEYPYIYILHIMGFLKAYYQVDDHPHHREPMGVWTPAHIKLAGDFNFSNVNFRTFLYSQNLNVPAILNEQVEVSGIKLGVNIFVSFFQLKATKRLPICNKAYHLNKEWGHTTKNPNKRYKRQFLTGEEGYRDIGTSNSINQSINQSFVSRGISGEVTFVVSCQSILRSKKPNTW